MSDVIIQYGCNNESEAIS